MKMRYEIGLQILLELSIALNHSYNSIYILSYLKVLLQHLCREYYFREKLRL